MFRPDVLSFLLELSKRKKSSHVEVRQFANVMFDESYSVIRDMEDFGLLIKSESSYSVNTSLLKQLIHRKYITLLSAEQRYVYDSIQDGSLVKDVIRKIQRRNSPPSRLFIKVDRRIVQMILKQLEEYNLVVISNERIRKNNACS